MDGIIGKYSGRKVYRTNTTDYINKKLYNNKENIYIVNREMIYKNEVFATYDGMFVQELDYNQRYIFYKIPETATVEAKVMTDGKGVRYVEYETHLPAPTGNSKNEMKNEGYEPKDVEATLMGVYDTDYSSLFTNVDAFLENALKN